MEATPQFTPPPLSSGTACGVARVDHFIQICQEVGVIAVLGGDDSKVIQFWTDFLKVGGCCASKHLSCNILEVETDCGDLVAQECEIKPPSPTWIGRNLVGRPR